MTQLICQVQRLHLKGGKLIKEKEVFEVEEPTATEYVKGGIAKPAPASEEKPEPVKVEEPEDGTVQTEETRKIEPQGKKRR
jgi:hypothetical protein